MSVWNKKITSSSQIKRWIHEKQNTRRFCLCSRAWSRMQLSEANASYCNVSKLKGALLSFHANKDKLYLHSVVLFKPALFTSMFPERNYWLDCCLLRHLRVHSCAGQTKRGPAHKKCSTVLIQVLLSCWDCLFLVCGAGGVALFLKSWLEPWIKPTPTTTTTN